MRSAGGQVEKWQLPQLTPLPTVNGLVEGRRCAARQWIPTTHNPPQMWTTPLISSKQPIGREPSSGSLWTRTDGRLVSAKRRQLAMLLTFVLASTLSFHAAPSRRHCLAGTNAFRCSGIAAMTLAPAPNLDSFTAASAEVTKKTAEAAAAVADAAAAAAASAAPMVDAAADAAAIAADAATAAADAAASAAASAGPIVDAAGGAATAAVPLLTTGAQVAGTAAQLGLTVVGKTIEVAGPVAVEGAKVAIPALADGIKALTAAAEGSTAPVAPQPIELGEFMSSPFGQALASAAPYALGAAVAYAVGQVLLRKVKETIGPLVYPTIGALGLGVGLTSAINLKLLDPMDIALPAVGALVLLGGSAATLAKLNSGGDDSEGK